MDERDVILFDDIIVERVLIFFLDIILDIERSFKEFEPYFLILRGNEDEFLFKGGVLASEEELAFDQFLEIGVEELDLVSEVDE